MPKFQFAIHHRGLIEWTDSKKPFAFAPPDLEVPHVVDLTGLDRKTVVAVPTPRPP